MTPLRMLPTRCRKNRSSGEDVAARAETLRPPAGLTGRVASEVRRVRGDLSDMSGWAGSVNRVLKGKRHAHQERHRFSKKPPLVNQLQPYDHSKTITEL
jgi:hypothetical protein